MFTMASRFLRCHTDAHVVLLVFMLLESFPLLVAQNATNVLEHTDPTTAALPHTTANESLATSLLVALNATNVLEQTDPTTAALPHTTANKSLATSLLVALNATNVLEQTDSTTAALPPMTINEKLTTSVHVAPNATDVPGQMDPTTAAPPPMTINGSLATSLHVAPNATYVPRQMEPNTAASESMTDKERLATTLAVNQSTTMIATTAPDSMLCRRCLIAMVALATVAGIFMITTIVLCSKILNMPKSPAPQQRIVKMSTRSSPTSSSVQALWIAPASTIRERSEIWYGGAAKRQENGLGQNGRGSSEDADPWAQPPVPKARTSRGARQNSLSTTSTNRHLLAPPVITLNQISDFWQREGHSDNSSFKAVPSSRCTVSEAGAESNSTEEHGSEFFQAGLSVVEPVDPRYTIVGLASGGGSGSSQEEEEVPVVQPKVTQEQITAFLSRGRAPEASFRNGEVTLL